MPLPNRTNRAAIQGKYTVPESTAPLIIEELDRLINEPYQHVDYDLQPLTVSNLGHYIDIPLGDLRFHIS